MTNTETAGTKSATMATLPELKSVSKDELNAVVSAIKTFTADESVRRLPQRAVQAHVWHHVGTVSSVLTELRDQENLVRDKIMETASKLVYRFMGPGLDVTLARAGLTVDPRVNRGSSLSVSSNKLKQDKDFDIFCLDSKERMYLMLKNYGWLQEFFRRYPMHFYENSFAFVDNLPPKKLPVKVKVIGCGIGGSVAASGLAKYGIDTQAFEKRAEEGPRSVTSRYQNASWRAYDIAAKLVDEKAYETLVQNRQRINITYDDGTSTVVESDRVQIIIGAAIKAALDSARRYGCDIHFESATDKFWKDEWEETDKCDIVALFCGTRTVDVVPGMAELMDLSEFPELDSVCKMWLRVQPSAKNEPYCARGGEVGAEKWHYTIESARRTTEDVTRILYNLESQNANRNRNGGDADPAWEVEYNAKKSQLESTLKAIETGNTPGGRFDYIFTNAPANEHNLEKRSEVAKDGSIVLDGGYTVQVKMASRCTFDDEKLLKGFNTDLVVCGGDACVPPNPLAAYGATLACEAAGSLVELAVATGHLNAILLQASERKENVDNEWIAELEYLKKLVGLHYEARGTAENYFQFVQTLICNLYSLPPFDGKAA